jgi:CheY-like chemotaxis protein
LQVRVARILVVDDEPDIAETVREVLQEYLASATIELAPTAEAAKAKLEKERFDLVLADEHMPGMGGSELLAWLKAAQPRTARVLMTAHTERVVRAKLGAQADLVLFKPFDIHRAVPALQGLLRDGSGKRA